MTNFTDREKSPAANSRFAKAGVSCFYDSEVQNSSFVLLIKFSASISVLSLAQNISIIQELLN